MPNLYKQSYTKTDPKTGKKYRGKSRKWYGQYVDESGQIQRVPLASDKSAAQAMLNELVRRAERRRAGIRDPAEDQAIRPLTAHLEDFRCYLESKENSAKHINQTEGRVKKVMEGCDFFRIPDISAAKVSGWLAAERSSGRMGIKTSNYYLQAFKSFCGWIARERRWPENPLAHFDQLSAETDIRRVRRAESPERLEKLLEATRQSKQDFRRLTGKDREALYLTAASTGLRAQELASLTPNSFELDGDIPSVTVQASYSKRRRLDVQPIPKQIAEILRPWLAEKAASNPGGRLWDSSWWNVAARMLRMDLKAAGISYQDERGRVFDFHALRHHFITSLAAAEVHPKTAQQLARHSTITLTMDRYTHLDQRKIAAALENVPLVAVPNPPEKTSDPDILPEEDAKKLTQQLTQNAVFPCPAVSADDFCHEDTGPESKVPKPCKNQDLGTDCPRVAANDGERRRPDLNRRWRICNPLP